MSIICWSMVPLPKVLTVTRASPRRQSVPQYTVSPRCFSTASLSPVSMDSSARSVPPQICPSAGIRSPARRHRMSPGPMSAMSSSVSVPSRRIRAVFGWRQMSLRMAEEASAREVVSRYLPKRIRESSTPPERKYSLSCSCAVKTVTAL